MLEKLNDDVLDQVAGGIVRVSGNKMKVSFSTLQEVYSLYGDPDEAALIAQTLYIQHKNEGDLAYENAVKAAFQQNGWI